MWVSRSLDRARRRLQPADEPTAPAPEVPEVFDDVVVSLVRPELERLIAGIAASLDPPVPRPDSPALLAGAIATAIRRIGGSGEPSVTRSPAGLYTPEYWHIRVNGADGSTRHAVSRLLAGERIG